ncbi:phage tail spike protein [Lactobacillus crispatus]|uniref:phage tail spike protein n=1 Tax=Lactobacillus crispatus TaxID=47770 RepID=UPI0018ABA805|nr:phage tail spike protein [Lactobacillus crispatus]
MIIYLLNKNQATIKAISTKNLIEAKYTEQINAANQLTFSVPLKNRLSKKVFYALFQKPDSLDFLMFKINDESIQNDRITYTGIDAAYDELKAYGYIKDIRPVKRTALEILQQVLKRTRWEPGNIPTTSPIDTNFYYQNYLDCIQQIAKLFNFELTFTYNFDTRLQRISSRKVNFYLQQGERTGKRFEYGSNLLEVTREEDSQEIYTALVGRGKGEEQTDEETGEATGGYGRRINFSDVVWSKANGDPADKPAGQEFIEDPEATKVFGYDDGKPRTGIVVFEDIEDPTELLQATWTALKSSERPKTSFKANVTDVGNLGLGDTIAIIRHELQIEYFTRVYKVTHDLQNKQNNVIEMGDDLSGNSLTSYVSDIGVTAQQASNQATSASVMANSKNKNYYSTTKPPIADEGDNLFLNLGNGEFEYWVWHNHQWEFVQSTQDLRNVEQNVKQAQQRLNEAKADIEKNKNEANEAITTINQTVTGLTAKVNDSVNHSELEQLSNQINLKVSKDDILGQINIAAGTTLIQNKKLYFDADSTVFSGKAFIPDAAITNISADKITAGTLDAGKINVININADNIVAGTLSGKNVNMDLTSGRIVFTAGRFYNQKETFDINIDENYIRSEKQTDYYGNTVNENYTITELRSGSINITRPNWHLNTNKEKWDWSFLGRENIFTLTTSQLTDNVFTQTSYPITAMYAKYGLVLTGDKFVNNMDILNIAGWNSNFTGIIIDTSNEGTITVSGSKGVTIAGGDVSTGNWLNSQAEILVGTQKREIDFNCDLAQFTNQITCNGLNVIGRLDVTGSLGIFGSKNAIVPTSKGMTAINAYETAEYYFGDIGKAKTDKNGQALIQLDPLFLETVNTSIPYHVFVSPYGNATVWVEQMDQNSFIVKSSKPNIGFSWEIKAKRKGYEDHRLKTVDKNIPDEAKEYYKEKGIM